MRHEHHVVETEVVHDGIDFSGLSCGRVPVTRRPVRQPPTQEIERNDVSFSQTRNQVVVEVQVVRKPVQQHDRRPRARKFTGIQVMGVERDVMFLERLHVSVAALSLAGHSRDGSRTRQALLLRNSLLDYPISQVRRRRRRDHLDNVKLHWLAADTLKQPHSAAE